MLLVQVPIESGQELKLNLTLHPQKIVLRKFRSGVDFLGYVTFPNHILPRTKTKRRLTKKIVQRIHEYNQEETSKEKLKATVNSYLGYLGHANTYAFRKKLVKIIRFELTGQEPILKNPNP